MYRKGNEYTATELRDIAKTAASGQSIIPEDDELEVNEIQQLYNMCSNMDKDSLFNALTSAYLAGYAVAKGQAVAL